MGDFLAYIRVSTQRQGEHGSSLQEQQDAIGQFADRQGIHIREWFEETETAAKQGRAQFSRMMRDLRRKTARGVIFHKIDRGARNLKDWNDIQELIELGIDVRFAHESLDMQTRGGQLTADLLAVIASDYIRNLRDEVKKGLQGRLKQGLYPHQAPLGYLDMGGGKPKSLDSIRAPLIRQAFELYASGQYSLHALCDELYRIGLRNRSGKKVIVNRMAPLLRHKFYLGLIEVKNTGTLYQGVHAPLVSRALFERVAAVLDGRLAARPVRHDFLFRKLVRCSGCKYALIGERQKGHTYYRCHTTACPTTTIREEVIADRLRDLFGRVTLAPDEAGLLLEEAKAIAAQWDAERETRKRALHLAKQQRTERLSRLTDALLDGIIDKVIFEEKKRQLYLEQVAANQAERDLTGAELYDRVAKFLELAKSLQIGYELADTLEKRELLRTITSNLSVSKKEPLIELYSPFSELANRHSVLFGAPQRIIPRTFRQKKSLKKLLAVIVKHVATVEELGHGVKYFQ